MMAAFTSRTARCRVEGGIQRGEAKPPIAIGDVLRLADDNIKAASRCVVGRRLGFGFVGCCGEGEFLLGVKSILLLNGLPLVGAAQLLRYATL
jgi:hypothetical protein